MSSIARSTTTAADRERLAEDIARRMDLPVTVLGILLVLLVLADAMATEAGMKAFLAVTSWVLWTAFAAEFGLRFVIAPVKRRFLKRNWWQLAFLLVPFLRFLRLAATLRTVRVGRILSSAVRGSRSASRLLSSRLGWLSSVTVIVALSASQLLYGFGEYSRYADALYDAAMATVTGEPTGQRVALARVLDVALALYSVVIVAAIAGTLGAFFLQRETERSAQTVDTPLASTERKNSPQ